MAMENLTPMLAQYQQIKSRHQDCILFFRLGDFYEMFYDDARAASRVLELVLTARGSAKSGKVPMCGIPYHAADSYINRLIKAGFKVAICEQTQDPALAKGIVEREVIRVITSGTFIDDKTADARYLLCLNPNRHLIGVSFIDAVGGVISSAQYDDMTKAVDVISRLPVFECIFPISHNETIKSLFKRSLINTKGLTMSPCDDWLFNPEIARKSLLDHFATHNLRGFGIEDMPCAIGSAGALLEYLRQMNRQPLRHIDRITLHSEDDHVFISPAACYGLGLDELVNTLDNTLTSFGKRLFRHWVYHPLKDIAAIVKRQKAVVILKDSVAAAQELSSILRNIPDIEKSLSRISCGLAQAKDLLALRTALAGIPQLQAILKEAADQNELFVIEDIPELRRLLEQAVNEEIPLSNSEGKIIRQGYNREFDELRDIQENGRQWLKNLQADEIKRSGISSLKIGFNQVFGYYIEVTRPNLPLVPADYIRKQTLVNAERFITSALKEFEEKMLTAEDKVLSMETEIIKQLQKHILDNTVRLHAFISRLAGLDALYALSVIAAWPGYVAPVVNDTMTIDIKNGRHPVVEKSLSGQFVPNDVFLDCQDDHLLIITGPNMAGKSTYIRQTAILTIMAQMGSFVPAVSANIGICDKIFTRIGAHDEISKGQSTFMVEMSEAAGILNNLSGRSLVILDELGRGTSTYDGLSLAWAISEHLREKKIRTLFATHFHELTALADEHQGVKNYNVEVKEWKDEVIFLHKIIPGGTDDSYGIYVAKLAGIPRDVVARSRQILGRLQVSGNLQEKIRQKIPAQNQMTLFAHADPLMLELKNDIQTLDINSLTPLDALKKLQEFKERIDNGQS